MNRLRTVSELAVLSTRASYPARSAARPVISHGRGCYLFDTSGRDYLDAGGGSGSMIFGHGDAELAELLAAQARNLSVFPSRYMTVEAVEEYAAKLVAFGPPGVCRSIFYSSGSDAVEAGIKLALQYHALRGEGCRHKIIGREASYHGNTLAGLAAGGFIRRRKPFESALAATAKAAATQSGSCSCGDERSRCELECAQTVERAILAEGPESVAAVILEPVVGAARSAAVPPPGYLSAVRDICQRYGVLLIADEVMTGFGRTGRHFAVEHWSVRADVLVLGKAISAGYYPLSGLLIDAEVAEVFESRNVPFQNAQTHTCSPVGCRIGQHVVDRICRERLEQRADRIGDEIRSEIRRKVRSPWLGEVRGLGLMIGVELGTRSKRAPPGLSEQLQRIAMDQGLLIYASSGSERSEAGEHFLLLPPLTIDASDVGVLLERLTDSFARLDDFVAERLADEGILT
ncbi:aspartate aminotransferase family protein [Bradyrhizobium sp. SZCCHNR2035]|uniref:aminotransferase family protein n=1 Tax=Bradyrhizobium sp. SZCCHNR2035 TaxID=3057386 RepID=UPI00291617AE|nr:aminotransferase class III-fold pyridoxal phosphate-dependent enzyme [Bradyrhizobium sp. SZCCHNR2035]